MNYKLIALDIDDTLLTSDRRVTPRTEEAIHAAEDAGVQVVLCTGRLPASLRYLYNDLGLKSATICSGGAQVLSPEGEVVYSCPIGEEDTHALLEMAHELHAYAHVYIGDYFCYEERTPYSDFYEGLCRFGGKLVPELRQMRITTPKLLMINEPDFTARIQPLFREAFPHLNIGRSRDTFIEFNNPKANKGNALAMLGRQLGIAAEEMIAVGDNQIDASMIRYAGLGVAMGNALPEIKDIAQFVCADNNHDGVAEVIEKFILGGTL